MTRGEVARGELADLPGADEQDRPALEVAEDLLRESRRRGRDRRGTLRDRRLCAHLASDVERLAEQPVEEHPGRAGLVGGPHLAEDLALAGTSQSSPAATRKRCSPAAWSRNRYSACSTAPPREG